MQTNNPEYEHDQIINNKEENHDINDNNEHRLFRRKTNENLHG